MKELIFFLQHLPYYVNPVALRLGYIQIRWYGIMYALSFFITYKIIVYRLKKEKINISKKIIDDYFFWMIIAIILGARIGYVLFYNLNYYLKNPLEIFLPFEFKERIRFIGISGLSYHGGLIGLIFGTLVFCYRKKINFWELSDLVALSVPLGYTFGRMGNFLNLELYGRQTDFILGMYFPTDPLNKLRHPSQLYEAFLEGIVLYLILSYLHRKIKIKGLIFSFYLFGYGFFRFVVEFFREPDAQLGFVLSGLTMGQVLCFFMMIAGVLVLLYNIRRKESYV